MWARSLIHRAVRISCRRALSLLLGLACTCSHLYQAETGCRPSTKYLHEQHGPAFQPDQYLDVSMRTTAVSWLVEVGMDFGLHQESLFLAVALLDRYLTATEVSTNPLRSFLGVDRVSRLHIFRFMLILSLSAYRCHFCCTFLWHRPHDDLNDALLRCRA